jgi:hypothetical protein
MKFLLVPAALLLLANIAAAEGQGMQENLQKILDDRSAELDHGFKARINQVIENTDRESSLVLVSASVMKTVRLIRSKTT